MKRRTLLLGAGVAAIAAAVPLSIFGVPSFLRRVLSDHFGSDVLEIEGIDDFVSEYASLLGNENIAKRLAADAYFGLRIDKVKKIGLAKALEERFLVTVLLRSNIIAIRQGRSEEFEFVSANPWQPVCGTYLSAFAEDST